LAGATTRCARRSTDPGLGPSPGAEEFMADIQRVGVLGCGLMGSGIAQVAATVGYDTIVRDVSKEVLDRGRAGIEKSLAKFVEKGKLQAADRDATLKRLTLRTTVADLTQ